MMSTYTLRRHGYRSYRKLLYPMKLNGMSSKLWLCQYYCMNAPHEVLREKEVHMNDTNCFEQILEEASNRTATVRPPTSLLTEHPSKTNKTCSTLLEK